MPSPVLVTQSLPLPHEAGERVRWGKVYGCAKALAIAELATSEDRSGRCILVLTSSIVRSEERRVGKECRSRWSPYH